MIGGLRVDGERWPVLLILIAAVAQGWALYGLHVAIRDELWPATDGAWLLALYATVLVLPATLQLLANEVRQRATWILSGCIGLAFFYFGWHHGSAVAPPLSERTSASFASVSIFVPLFVLWLMMLPFLACRLRNGHWHAPYHDYFTTAWRNKLLLAEAALFTGLFWLLLFLWGGLFALIGIEFFAELFIQPMFIYPVTAVVFGIALYLIGSVDRFVSVVLEQLLGLLKWLGVVAALILTLFTLALLLQIPQLLATDTRAIASAWLLWLLAVMVLFLNAAYRDGSIAIPYPAWIANAMKWVVPFMVVIALTALYSVILRIGDHGYTTTRFWGLIVAAIATLYAIGYSFAALRSSTWLGAMGPVNVGVAVVQIAILALALTPVLSPYRLAANSQYTRIINSAEVAAALVDPAQQYRAGIDAYGYLRFNTGNYGRAKLEQLAALDGHPQAAMIRERAQAALAATDYGSPTVVQSAMEIPLFPNGRSLDSNLEAALRPQGALIVPCDQNISGRECAGVFVDLDADNAEEFVLLMSYSAIVFRREGESWVRAGSGSPRYAGTSFTWKDLGESLMTGDFAPKTGVYSDLRVGGHVFQIVAENSPAPALAPDQNRPD